MIDILLWKNQHKEVSQFISLSVVLIKSVFKTGKNHYPQVFLEECKYVIKEKKTPEYITDNVEISSDSEREDFDEGNSNQENSDEENSDKKN